MQRKILILAGMRAAGKITLLNRAYEENLCIFGEENSQAFFDFFRDKFENEVIDHRTNNRKLKCAGIGKFFDEKKYLNGGNNILHVDIMSFYQRNIIRAPRNNYSSPYNNPPEKPTLIRPDYLSSMIRSENLRRELIANFFDFLKSYYDIICINTIYCDYERNKRQFLDRREVGKYLDKWKVTKMLKKNHFLHPDNDISRLIHRELYEFWEKDTSIDKITSRYKTIMSDDGYRFFQI